MRSTSRLKDKLAIAIYFLSGFIWLNIIESSIATNSIGLASLIAGVYGIVTIYKNKFFLFE